jgi:type 1 glutamine amidotransferase
LHTASICFDDWPRWSEIIGAGWIWGTSYHPPRGPVSVKMTTAEHPITRGLQGFAFDDEAYSKMDLAPGLEPLAMVQAASQDTPSPCLWTRDVGKARVVYDALGHDSSSFEHPTHRTIVQRSARWATRQSLTS